MKVKTFFNTKTNTKLVMILMLLAGYSSAHAQEEGDVIMLKSDVPAIGEVKMIQSKGINENDKVKFLESGIKYKVGAITENSVELRALNFIPYTKEYKKEYLDKYGSKLRDLSDYYNYKIYTVKKSDLEKSMIKINPGDRLTFGVLMIPYKIRPYKKFSYSTNVNINSVVNYRFRPNSMKKTHFNLQLGAGTQKVKLDDTNSIVKKEKSIDVHAFTVFTGLMLSHKKLQIGLYAGFDWINNQKNYDWDYHNRIWLGFGAGYNLFTIKKAKEKEKSNKQIK